MMQATMCLVLAGSLGAGCMWTEFDDLADETWVNSTEKPDVNSNIYGVALQRGTDDRLVVLGADRATLSELAYDQRGESRLAQPAKDLAELGLTGLEDQPLLIADPASENIALVTNFNSQVLVIEGSGSDLENHMITVTPPTPTAATYLRVAGTTESQILFATGDLVVPTRLGQPTTTQPTCKLTDAGTAIQPRALAAVSSGVSDDVIAWGASGKLYRYPGSVFNGCATMQEPSAGPVDTQFMPGTGAQILALDNNRILLQGHRGPGDPGFLRVFDATTLVAVGEAIPIAGLRSAAILDAGTTKYVIAGYPSELVDGKTAGRVRLFEVDTNGLKTAPVATFNDAQPEDNQSFGRAVAAMTYGDGQVIAVAADNEIFVYFRADPLYGETRQGR